MSFGITKTIPAKAGVETLNSLYDGSRKEYEFHMDILFLLINYTDD